MVTTWAPMAPDGTRVLEPAEAGPLLRRLHLQAQVCHEGLVMVRALDAWDRGERRGYQNHGVVKAWRGHTRALALYLLEMTATWVERDYLEPVTAAEFRTVAERSATSGDRPFWWGHSPIHAQHAASLVARNPEHYVERFPGVTPIPHFEPFLWPPDPTSPDAEGLLAEQVDAYALACVADGGRRMPRYLVDYLVEQELRREVARAPR